MTISITKTQAPKAKPDYANLGFGKHFTDHMFLMDYTPDKGWHDPRIVPYGALELDPASMVFHYAQETFEGMKAYYTPQGKIQLFRPWNNFERMNSSDNRLCIPPLDVDDCVEAVKTLLRVDSDWMPKEFGTSMYIRPFVIATDAHLGVRASNNYLFAIILSPVGSYYAGGMAPTKIFVETEDVRAVRGGTGEAKAGANYSATIRAQHRAGELGYSQVLWLDGIEKKYVEEIGTSNAFFKIGGTVYTPPLTGSILPGITRRSVIEMLKAWGESVEEKRLAISEVIEAAENGTLDEAFASGTAAVISPIGTLHYEGKNFAVNGGNTGPTAQKIYDTLTGIQWGRTEDTFGWTVVV
ncbi:branched-chain amino acid aminotransferase [Oscillospiraceae bacterium OttesenSCG-928-F05]|nr:branched-chain amino acid aminotransferase [Oscillospiraceae bacterium OttesenSCG-928-F05]